MSVLDHWKPEAKHAKHMHYNWFVLQHHSAYKVYKHGHSDRQPGLAPNHHRQGSLSAPGS